MLVYDPSGKLVILYLLVENFGVFLLIVKYWCYLDYLMNCGKVVEFCVELWFCMFFSY